MSQADLIQSSDLLQNGASSDFMDQFQPRPLLVKIIAGGALGTMTWAWQQVVDPAYSETIPSESIGGSWSYTPKDPAFAILAFAPGTYVANDVYTVSTTGTVTGGSGGGIGLLSATRFDVRKVVCTRVTSDAVTWMQPRVVPPIISVGAQIIGWMCDIAIFRLRNRQGMTPPNGGAGDDNTRLQAENAEKNLKLIGASADRPPDIVDSSQGNTGAGFPAMPASDTLRGW